MSWKTKDTDRFILRFIKTRLSAPLSGILVRSAPGIDPMYLTIVSACVGLGAGIAFGIGIAWAGGLMTAVAQIADGMDGQVARLTGTQSARGAFLDSVLDRYVDFSLLFGMMLHCLRFSANAGHFGISPAGALIVLIAALAAAGSSQISYATARASDLGLRFPRPEIAGRGTRNAVITVCGILTPLWIHFPLVALLFLALHTNVSLAVSIWNTNES